MPAILDGMSVLTDGAQAELMIHLCLQADEPLLGNIGAMRALDALDGRC